MDFPDQLAQHPRLSWALCIATLNRIDILEQSVKLALSQTVLPKEIIIVDAGEDWVKHSEKIRNMSEWLTTTLVYRNSAVLSLTSQRNQALSIATADILFFFDDDTLMHPECAEQILRVYSLDLEHRIAAVAASPTQIKPGSAEIKTIDFKNQSRSRQGRAVLNLLPERIKRFIADEILMLSLERRFVPYDAVRYPSHLPLDIRFRETGAFPTTLISGFRVTVRKSVSENEPFDDGLIAYCPAEDLDATYRYLRHGINVQAPLALVYHHEAASARLKRRKVAELSLLNVAYFLKSKARTPSQHQILYYIFAVRMLVSCSLRDAVGRRWNFPDTIGSLLAIRKSFTVFRTPTSHLRKSYVHMQQQILSLNSGKNKSA